MTRGARPSDDAATPMLALLIALMIFSMTFGYLIFSSVSEGRNVNTGNRVTADLDGAARSLATLIVSEPGQGWYPSAACVDGTLDSSMMHPDQVAAVGRFGLGREDCEQPMSPSGDINHMDYDKILNLQDALLAADGSNGHVDYAEARKSLGLDVAIRDFHIRSEPVLADVREILATGFKDPNLRPLYLGDYEESAANPIQRPSVSHSGTVTNGADFATVTVTITNDGLDTIKAPFQVSFSVPLLKGAITSTQNVFDILIGASDTVELKLRKTTDWTWGPEKKVEYTISDSFGPLASGHVILDSIEMTNPANNAINDVVVVNMDRLRYVEAFSANNKWPQAIYSGYDGKGVKKANFDGSNVDLKVVEVAPGTYTKTYTNPNKNGQGLQDTAPDPDEPADGKYRVQVWVPDTSGTMHNDDVFEVLDGGARCNVNEGDYVPSSSATVESQFVDALFERYDHGVYSAVYDAPALGHVAGGDVMPDLKCPMDNDLPNFLLDDAGEPTLDVYSVLIVGSNVQHNAMTSSAAKETIRDWVYAGGLLLVFGSTEQAVQWLQPIFHSAIDSAGGGISVPDENHPVLNVPNDLDYTAYDHHGIVWDFSRDADRGHFTHVITDNNNDYLAVSDSGEFGEGRVVLASYQPFDLTTDQAAKCTPPTLQPDCQALMMIHNFVTIAYRGLYLDYGPPLPADRPHGSVIRLGTTDHPELDARVAMKMLVYVF